MAAGEEDQQASWTLLEVPWVPSSASVGVRPFEVPGPCLEDQGGHCKEAVLEDQGTQKGGLHRDGEDQEDPEAQDTRLAVQELLLGKEA